MGRLQYNDITPDDYRIIVPQMLLLLNTLKGLRNTYKKIRTTGKLSEEVEALGRNYSAIYELNSDIKNFRAKTISPELSNALKKASVAMKQMAQLNSAIHKGLDSGIAENFEPVAFLQTLKVRHNAE